MEQLDYSINNMLPSLMQRTPFLPRYIIWLTLLAALWAVIFNCGQSSTDAVPLTSVKTRIAQALTEKKADDRLKTLAGIGSNLSLADIPDALVLANSLTELRARAVLHDAIVKRWSQLAPAEAWAYVAKLPEGR